MGTKTQNQLGSREIWGHMGLNMGKTGLLTGH